MAEEKPTTTESTKKNQGTLYGVPVDEVLEMEKSKVESNKKAWKEDCERRKTLHESQKAEAAQDLTAEPAPEVSKEEHEAHITHTKAADAETEAQARAEVRAHEQEVKEKFVSENKEFNESFDAMVSEEQKQKEAAEKAKAADAEAAARANEEKLARQKEVAEIKEKKRAEMTQIASRKQAAAQDGAKAHAANVAARREMEQTIAARRTEGKGYVESEGREIIPGTERKTPREVYLAEKVEPENRVLTFSEQVAQREREITQRKKKPVDPEEKARKEEKIATRNAEEEKKVSGMVAHLFNKKSRRDIEASMAARKSEEKGYVASAGREIVPGTEGKTPRQIAKEKKE